MHTCEMRACERACPSRITLMVDISTRYKYLLWACIARRHVSLARHASLSRMLLICVSHRHVSCGGVDFTGSYRRCTNRGSEVMSHFRDLPHPPHFITQFLLGIPLTTHIYRTCINQALIDTAYVLGLWPRLRPVPNSFINHSLTSTYSIHTMLNINKTSRREYFKREISIILVLYIKGYIIYEKSAIKSISRN
jgi:hypothetical protein